jgi:hypothetical protein
MDSHPDNSGLFHARYRILLLAALARNGPNLQECVGQELNETNTWTSGIFELFTELVTFILIFMYILFN